MRYEYECSQCHKIYEKNHSIKENPQYICDKCNGQLKRNVTNANFILKGWGWSGKDSKRSKDIAETNANKRRKAKEQQKEGRSFIK